MHDGLMSAFRRRRPAITPDATTDAGDATAFLPEDDEPADDAAAGLLGGAAAAAAAGRFAGAFEAPPSAAAPSPACSG